MWSGNGLNTTLSYQCLGTAWAVALRSEAMRSVVLIGPSEHLPALQARDDLGEAIGFADTDALLALDVITRQRPEVVAIERGFAGTSRGAALIGRIKADPGLIACEIRVVAHDSDYVRVSPRSEGEAGPVLAATAAAPAVAEAVPPAVVALDQRGTRRALRFKIAEGVNVQIDGNTTSLINLSVLGAEVVSPTILKPNQRVWFTLPDSAPVKRCRAVVIWAAFEIPKGVGHYRVGIEFSGVDQESLVPFIQANKR